MGARPQRVFGGKKYQLWSWTPSIKGWREHAKKLGREIRYVKAKGVKYFKVDTGRTISGYYIYWRAKES